MAAWGSGTTQAPREGPGGSIPGANLGRSFPGLSRGWTLTLTWSTWRPRSSEEVSREGIGANAPSLLSPWPAQLPLSFMAGPARLTLLCYDAA